MTETHITDAERQRLLQLITTAIINEPSDKAGNRRRTAWLELLRKIDGPGTILVVQAV